MLILTRRIGEALIFTDGDTEIRMSILKVKGNQIRIGVEAPRNVTVDREEIHQRKLKEQEDR